MSGWQGMKPEGRSLTLSPCSITHLYGVFRRRLQSPPTAVVTDGSGDKGPGLQRDVFLLGRIKEETERGCYLVFGAEQSDAGAASSLFRASVSPPVENSPPKVTARSIP